MAFYVVKKSGHFSEERFNKVGAIVEIDQLAAKVAEERGFLEITTKKPTPIKPIKPIEPEPKGKVEGKLAKPKSKAKAKPKKK